MQNLALLLFAFLIHPTLTPSQLSETILAKLDVIIKSDVLQGEPVFYVLERIRSQLGTNQEDIKHQGLYVNERRIHDQQMPLDYYRIFGSTLTYRALVNKNTSLQVTTLSGETLPMVCQSSRTVKEFKHLYCQQYGAPLVQARFIFEDQVMRDEFGFCMTLDSKRTACSIWF